MTQPELCQTCARRWGKSLHVGECVCNGKVTISYTGPTPVVPRQEYQIQRRVMSLQEEKRVKKKGKA